MDDKKDDEKTIGSIIIVGIVVTLIFMILIGYISVKIYNQEICRIEEYSSFDRKNFVDSPYPLNNAGEYVLQEIKINDTSNLGYEFCYYANVSSAKGLQVQVIDKWDNSLGTHFVTNLSSYYCTEVDNEYITRQNYLGVKCVNCDANNNITIRSELLGSDVLQIHNGAGEEIVYYDDTLAYLLKAKVGCKSWLKFISWLYLLFLFFIFLLVGIMAGYGKTREILFEKW